MPRTGQPSQERVAALGRSLAIVDALAVGGELGTNEIARRVGTNPSTVSRQLGSLVESKLVERVPHNGRYRLGIRIVELANSVLRALSLDMPEVDFSRIREIPLTPRRQVAPPRSGERPRA